jgi:hypothetical protein
MEVKVKWTRPAFQPNLLMRMSSPLLLNLVSKALPEAAWHFSSGDDPDDAARKLAQFGKATAGREDLPYRVELWDEAKSGVEQILAVTANGSIGYAAFYAATREHPTRYVTLRHKNSIISRWNGPEH